MRKGQIAPRRGWKDILGVLPIAPGVIVQAKRSTMHQIAKCMGIKVACRELAGGFIRVWRVE